MLSVGEVEVSLGGGGEEIVLILVKEDIKIPPRTIVSSKGVVNSGRELSSRIYQIAGKSDEEVSIWESILEGDKVIPMLISNTSSKTVKVKKGEKVGQASPIRNVSPVRIPGNSQRSRKATSCERKEEIVVPEKIKRRIISLLWDNNDVVANNKELGRTQTVKMRTDTGDQLN